MRHPFSAHWTICSILLSLPQFDGAAAQAVFAADAEPNDRFSQATPIQLGFAFEGQLNVLDGDQFDLYTFVLPDDGVLQLEVESEQEGSAIPFLAIRGYASSDSVNVMPGAAFPTMGTFGSVALDTVSIPCMKAGTHYLRIGATLEDTSSTPRSYRIIATHRPMAFANDVEPNDTPEQAIPLLAGEWVEGRLSVEWPFNDPMDMFDYYVIHKTTTGPLVLYTELAAEYENIPAEPGNFLVHDASWSVVSDGEGSVDMGSQGVPITDIAVYPTMMDTGHYYVRLFNPQWFGLCYRFSYGSGTVGIEEERTGRAPQVWPNPSNAVFSFAVDGASVLEINDLQGRTLERVALRGKGIHTWDATGVAPGSYTARAIYSDGHQGSVVIVKVE